MMAGPRRTIQSTGKMQPTMGTPFATMPVRLAPARSAAGAGASGGWSEAGGDRDAICTTCTMIRRGGEGSGTPVVPPCARARSCAACEADSLSTLPISSPRRVEPLGDAQQAFVQAHAGFHDEREQVVASGRRWICDGAPRCAAQPEVWNEVPSSAARMPGDRRDDDDWKGTGSSTQYEPGDSHQRRQAVAQPPGIPRCQAPGSPARLSCCRTWTVAVAGSREVKGLASASSCLTSVARGRPGCQVPGGGALVRAWSMAMKYAITITAQMIPA